MLNELPRPEIEANNIYSYAYNCTTCPNKKWNEEVLQERIETNDLCSYNVDKLIFRLERRFPSYESVQSIIPNTKQKRYKMFSELFSKMMCCSDKQEFKNWIEMKKYAVYNTRMDFNRIMHIYFKNFNFLLLE